MRASLFELLDPRRLFSGNPMLVVSDGSLLEGNSGTQYAAVTVSLSAPSTKTVGVNYGTTDGTATAGSDYAAVSGKLTFAPGETSKSIAVSVRGDRAGEANETVFVKLRAAKNASIANGYGVLTILDDEPRIRISDASGQEVIAGGTGLLTFAVSLSAISDAPVTVNYATGDGSFYASAVAAAGLDYVPAAGTLTFAPGETTKFLIVQLLDDAEREPIETFVVNLSGANAFIEIGQSFGTIGADPFYVEEPYQWWTDSSWYN